MNLICRWLLAVTVLLLAASTLIAQSKRARKMDVVELDQELPRLSALLAQCIQSNNVEAIDPIISEDFVLVDSSGAVKSKAQFISSISSGHVRVASVKLNDVQVQILGESALISGQRAINSESNCEDFKTAVLSNSTQNTKALWTAFEQHLRRRADLLPIIYQSLLSAGVNEAQVMGSIASARSQLLNALLAVPASGEDQEKSVQQRQAIVSANSNFDEALMPLYHITTNYPQLRSHVGFVKSMEELRRTEHKIQSAKCALNKVTIGENPHRKSYTVRFIQIWIKLQERRASNHAKPQLQWRLLREQLTLISPEK